MVAVPGYASAAVEHWGIVTYRETRLLYDNHQHSDFDRQRTVSIIAHELAHNVRPTMRDYFVVVVVFVLGLVAVLCDATARKA